MNLIKSQLAARQKGILHIMPEQWVGGAQFRFLADFPFHTAHICQRLGNIISPFHARVFSSSEMFNSI